MAYEKGMHGGNASPQNRMKGKVDDGFKSCDLKKSFGANQAKVKTSRLNAGGDMAWKGKRAS